jgi:hypothetical protein
MKADLEAIVRATAKLLGEPPVAESTSDLARGATVEHEHTPSASADRPRPVVIDELSKIADLKEQGVLPDEQFQAMKMRLLAELASIEQRAAEEDQRAAEEEARKQRAAAREEERLEAERVDAERREWERQEKVIAEERAKQEQLAAAELSREHERAAKGLAKEKRQSRYAKAASTLKSTLYDEELAKRLRDERQTRMATATTAMPLQSKSEQSSATGEPPPPTPGWYPMSGDRGLQAYWDGQQWSAYTQWDGTAWVDVVPDGYNNNRG